MYSITLISINFVFLNYIFDSSCRLRCVKITLISITHLTRHICANFRLFTPLKISCRLRCAKSNSTKNIFDSSHQMCHTNIDHSSHKSQMCKITLISITHLTRHICANFLFTPLKIYLIHLAVSDVQDHTKIDHSSHKITYIFDSSCRLRCARSH